MVTDERKIDISVVDNKQLEELHGEILTMILESRISYYSALGLLELVKQDLMDSMFLDEFK